MGRRGEGWVSSGIKKVRTTRTSLPSRNDTDSLAVDYAWHEHFEYKRGAESNDRALYIEYANSRVSGVMNCVRNTSGASNVFVSGVVWEF